MPLRLKRTTCWRNRSPDLDNFSTPCRLAENASAGAAMAGPSLPRPPALHQLHLGRTGPIGPDRCQYNLLNPRRGIMMRFMQSFHTRARRRRNARGPEPSGPTAPRSENMSFSHRPARHPTRRMKCNPGRSHPLQPPNVDASKFSQTECWGCRFISKSIGKK
jgi:hypothetical protein